MNDTQETPNNPENNPVEQQDAIKVSVPSPMQDNIHTGKPKSRKLLLWNLAPLLLLVMVVMVLVANNAIRLNDFTNVTYANSDGNQYSLDFYTNHKTTKLDSGQSQLVAQNEKYGKYPLTVSISTTDTSALNRNSLRTCSGPLPKLMEIYNQNLNQTLSVCYFPQEEGPVGVYIVGFEHTKRAHIVTFSQDVSRVDQSGRTKTLESLSKFGIEPYKSDIRKILASIRIE